MVASLRDVEFFFGHHCGGKFDFEWRFCVKKKRGDCLSVFFSCSCDGCGTHLSKLRFVSLCAGYHDGTAADVSPVDVHPSSPSSGGWEVLSLVNPPNHHPHH